MTKQTNIKNLDVLTFINTKSQITQEEIIQNYPRLKEEIKQETNSENKEIKINTQITGITITSEDKINRPAINLKIKTKLPLSCQRCMNPIEQEININTNIIFTKTEKEAEELDEELEEDVLTISKNLNLQEIIEDEILMNLPISALHEACGENIITSTKTKDYDQSNQKKKNPFAILENLKNIKQ